MKRTALLVVFLGSLLACGGTDSTAPTPRTPPPPPPPPNRAPQAVGTIPAQTMTAGDTATLDVSSFFTDPDGDALTYTAASSDAAVAAAAMSGSRLTVTAMAEGSTTVTVTATDPGGLTATQSAAVTVEAANRAPVATVAAIPPQSGETGDTVRVDASPLFSDPDGDALTYSAATSDSAVAAVDVAGSVVTVSLVGVGTATITVTATDPGGLSASLEAAVTVTQANRAPVATVSAIPPQSGETGETVQVDVSPLFSDPDGDALTYSAATSDSAVAEASVAGSVVTVSLVGAGTATITVTATDPGGLAASLAAAVTVTQPNRAPVATVSAIPPQSGETGETVEVDVSPLFSDPDGDALTYSAVTSDSAVAEASVAGSVVTVSLVGAGTARITVTATDPGGLSASLEAAVTVEDPLPPPPGFSVHLRIEPSQSQSDAFRVLADPTFSVDEFDLEVYLITGDDEATWEFSNNQPITADEGRVELADLNLGATPQPLEDVTKVKVVFDESLEATHVLLCAIVPGRSSRRVEATCSPAPPPHPPTTPFDGSVDLRIEPSQSQSDAFRVLADPTFFAGEFDLEVYLITGDDAATWEFTNDQPITADEGRVELTDSNIGATPQPLEDVTRVKVVYDVNFRTTHVLLCTIVPGRSSGRVEATCSPAPPPHPPTTPFDGSVDLRIEPSQSQSDAFRVLADPTFFAGEFDLEVYLITGDDAATWEFTNDQPITADEGRVELTDSNIGATPQPLEDVTRLRVVYDEDFRTSHVLLCSISDERSSQRIEASCSTP